MTTQTDTAPLLAATRDASFFDNPDTRSVKSYHILRPDGTAACGLKAFMCDDEPAERIHESHRCRRQGCKQRWPAITG